MRQGHQNRRGRSRNNSGGGSSSSNSNNNNNNRKGQNPLTRTFESNGPDVKIRGTPTHIAEKYITLARDAKSSGDEVLAENYLQHAEHYNRIIIAFREQQVSQGGEMAGGGMGQRFRVPQLHDNLDDEDSNEEVDEIGADQSQHVMRQNEPQPSVVQPLPPFEGGERPERSEGRDPQRSDRSERHQGGGRYEDRPRRHADHFRQRDREPRQNDFPRHAPGDRPAMEPQTYAPDRGPSPPVAAIEPGFEPINGQRPRPPERGASERVDVNQPRRRERFQPQPPAQHEQPEFLRRPVRRPRRDVGPDENGEPGPSGAAPNTPPGRDDGNAND